MEHSAVGLARKNLRVCVLDGDLEGRDILVKALERAGFPVTSTTVPSEALQEVQLQHCRAVLADAEIPRMNGLAFLEKSLQCNPGVQVILMTRFCSVDSAIQAIKRGACDYLCKPLDPSRLMRALDELAEASARNSAHQDQAGSVGANWQPLRLDEVRRMHIQRVLELCDDNRVRAARLLGIGRTSLYRFLKRYDSAVPEVPEANAQR